MEMADPDIGIDDPPTNHGPLKGKFTREESKPLLLTEVRSDREELVHGRDRKLGGGQVTCNIPSPSAEIVDVGLGGSTHNAEQIPDPVAGGRGSGNPPPAKDKWNIEDKWNIAIERKDSVLLMKLLKENVPKKNENVNEKEKEKENASTLLQVELRKAQKYEKEEGRTVLQIAAMQGCFPLVKEILDQLMTWCELSKEAKRETRMLDYIGAVEDLSGLTALQMANDIIGNRSISEFIEYTLQRVEKLDRDDHPNFFEAYPEAAWFTALETGHSGDLHDLLLCNSRLLLETSRGLTVLHVAILADDLELVKAVVALFGSRKEVHWGESYYPQSLQLKRMVEIHRNINFHDLAYLNKFWDGSEWVTLEAKTLKQVKKHGCSALALARALRRREILKELEMDSRDEDVTDQGVTPFLPEYSLPPGTTDCISREWKEEWNEGFLQDVDYNFEEDQRRLWLRFHYACKDPLKFKGFLEKVHEYIDQDSNKDIKLFQMRDAQGRTPFHILLDHYNQEKPPGWPFDEIFTGMKYKNAIQYAEDARGRRVIDILLTKNYLQQNIILQPWSYFKMAFQQSAFERGIAKDNCHTTFMYYQVAFLLKQRNVAQEIWSRILVKKDMKKLMNKYIDEFRPALFIAASTGNQTNLQLLLEAQSDPMITDTKGRTLLHHAADATLLQFHFIGHCFSTVEDMCEVRKKWTEQTYFSSTADYLYKENLREERAQRQSMNANSNIDLDVDERSNVGRKACILMLLQAGVDLSQADKDGKVPNIGPTNDATYQSWWYDMVVKDSTDKKNSFNQAGNALSVVGTLVAATSYIGPLQPPMSYNEAGFVKSTETLVKVFMVSNSLAFYLAVASVMFAVVPSLPMPREGVVSEVRRAQHMVTFSLCLLLIAIGLIIISFAATSMVVIQHEHSFHWSDLLFGPSIIGWTFCFIAIVGFLIRVARLMFYENPTIRRIYQFSFSEFSRNCLQSLPISLLIIFIISIAFIPILAAIIIIIFIVFVATTWDTTKKIRRKVRLAFFGQKQQLAIDGISMVNLCTFSHE